MEKKRISKEEFLEVLKSNPIIAAVREEERLLTSTTKQIKSSFPP